MLQHMKIGRRLLLMVAGSVLVAVLVGGFGLMEMRSQLLDDRKVKTRHLVEAAVSIAGHFHSLETSGAMTREQAQEAAKSTI